jgi:thiol-disulfide isomerase/thioredoxin
MKRELRAATLAILLAAVVGTIYETSHMRNKGWLSALAAGAIAAPSATSAGEPLQAMRHATAWLNSPPLTEAELRGKVVLVDFWTYTCINWLRTLPYVRAWAEKYRDQGLVVIGVHTPEFQFEEDAENVRAAIAAMGITYPVVTDNDYSVWRAFRNSAWPALYFVDAQGRVRSRHFGEGEYAEAEQTIRRLLAEAGRNGPPAELVSVDAHGLEVAADWGSLKSPETYLGYERTANFASRSGPVFDVRRTYVAPERLGLNHWALSGNWTFRKQFVALNEPGGRIAYRFHSRDVHLVMGPATRGTAVRFRVLIDGQPPGPAHGVDVDEQGYGMVNDQRLYQLIRQPSPIVEHNFEIDFLDAHVEAFAFTFG